MKVIKQHKRGDNETVITDCGYYAVSDTVGADLVKLRVDSLSSKYHSTRVEMSRQEARELAAILLHAANAGQ